ncbi:ubiquitin carboxyl-terminal hydrolase family protein, putative [Ichthyophthirius multifiliis]|uniref:Ubiquitin carboxyl-terminal hydrolase family protein, putative n=1 Tax=Ichthyophthirius multifiliis TaxID=5932 RepID=G0QTB9_ICHMU|nr:ubiquitin carboxyl-terminal hydrolase family protein, putative [Ichthyophthirius multifiliis]EGR31554.1 ubiquitin carboxyl-terminal hydrolase family protein, putative [Ichthyophthirius multifiliis]|eukprot:XP_004035040.1 ubiquitin carboxyl-terminal hydrolase family protein, putative [Ichthyophthirius multifiliis]
MFNGYQQHDAQEFLALFLDVVHEDLNRVKVKILTQEIESEGKDDQLLSKLHWENHLKRNSSVIVDLIQVSCQEQFHFNINQNTTIEILIEFMSRKHNINKNKLLFCSLTSFRPVLYELDEDTSQIEFSQCLLIPVFCGNSNCNNCELPFSDEITLQQIVDKIIDKSSF